jgi:hypothetical protein
MKKYGKFPLVFQFMPQEKNNENKITEPALTVHN